MFFPMPFAGGPSVRKVASADLWMEGAGGGKDEIKRRRQEV